MSRARGDGPVRRLKRFGIRTIRRSGLLPSTIPDRLGDDDRLVGSRLDQTVMLYFPDTRESLYQLRPWYAALRELNARYPVVCVFQDSRTAAIVREELGLPVLTIARYGRLDDLLSRSEVKLALYVNHSPQNFSALRFTSLAHVYLTHGDSDKGVSVSNQGKAYDFCFVAGQAAIDRMVDKLMFTDPREWCIPIGRPQLDSLPVVSTGSGHLDRPTVLYAPTWEGAQPSVAYGSIASHGVRLARALLDSGRAVLVYRPHPLAGVTDPLYGTADAQIRALVAEAQRREPSAGHRVETEGPLEASFADADLLICDVSAVAMDWLPSGKPFVVTQPADAAAATAATAMLDLVPRLTVEDLPGVVDLVVGLIADDTDRDKRLELVDYYLGDVSPGASTKRFLEACAHVIDRRDQAWAAITARGPAGP